MSVVMLSGRRLLIVHMCVVSAFFANGKHELTVDDMRVFGQRAPAHDVVTVLDRRRQGHRKFLDRLGRQRSKALLSFAGLLNR